MLIIGLCGTSGSGKGYVCEKLKEHGIECIDTDKLYATSVVAKGSECLSELCMFFGRGILNGDGTLNKKALSQKVFEGENASQHLKVLNTITHKYIKTDVEKILLENEKSGVTATVIDAPVLFESGFNEMCDVTVCVTAPERLKLERIMLRDKIPYEKALARVKSQLPNERLRELCDYEIANGKDSDVDTQIKEFLQKININI